MRRNHQKKTAVITTAPAPVSAASPPANVDRTQADKFRSIAFAGMTVGLLALCVLLALPFLTALAWGAAFSIVAYPLHLRVRRKVLSPTYSAMITTTVVVIGLVVPGLFVTWQLAQEATHQSSRIKNSDIQGTLTEELKHNEGTRRAVEWAERMNVDIGAQIRKGLDVLTQGASDMLAGSLWAIVQFALAIFILFHFLKDGPILRERVRGLLPMSREECDQVFRSAADSVHANINAQVTTSLIDAVSGALVFWALGLPSPVLWGTVIFFMSILPMLGTFVIWLPAAVYLIFINDWPSAIALALWGIATAVFVDSILYIRLAGRRMRLHTVPSLLSFLGGLALFGASGMVLGPAILAVTIAFIEVWKHRPVFMDQAPAPAPVEVTVHGDAQVEVHDAKGTPIANGNGNGVKIVPA